MAIKCIFANNYNICLLLVVFCIQLNEWKCLNKCLIHINRNSHWLLINLTNVDKNILFPLMMRERERERERENLNVKNK